MTIALDWVTVAPDRERCPAVSPDGHRCTLDRDHEFTVNRAGHIATDPGGHPHTNNLGRGSTFRLVRF